MERDTTEETEAEEREIEEGETEEREQVDREETEREGVDEEDSWDRSSELEREAVALARWRRPEGFGESRRAEEEQMAAGWNCCGNLIGRGRGRGRGRGNRFVEDVGMDSVGLQWARHDILMNARRTTL